MKAKELAELKAHPPPGDEAFKIDQQQLNQQIAIRAILEEEFITNDKKRQELTNQALREWVDKYGKGVLETAIKPYLKSSPLS